MGGELDEVETEEDAVRSGMRRQLGIRLMAAGLRHPNRKITEESFVLEMRLRHEAQAREDSMIARLRKGLSGNPTA